MFVYLDEYVVLVLCTYVFRSSRLPQSLAVKPALPFVPVGSDSAVQVQVSGEHV